MRSVLITGFEKHASYLATLLNAHTSMRAAFYRDTRISRYIAFAHAAIAEGSITFGGPRPKPIIQALCTARNRPAIVIWAGSDVAALSASPQELELLRLERLTHWAAGTNLASEVRQLGIEARYVPVASAVVPAHAAPMPSAFTVLTYLPEPRRAFYGESAVWAAARALPRCRFIAVGRGRPTRGAPPNVRYVGEVANMNAYIDAASVLFRLPEHDNDMCQGVIEALARGRHVVWTHGLPGVLNVASHTEGIKALVQLYQNHTAGSLHVNHTGMEHVSAALDPATVACRVAQAFDEARKAARDSRCAETVKPRSIVISGVPILSARVAANVRSYSHSLEACVVSTSTAGDVGAALLKILTSDVFYTIGEPKAGRLLEAAAAIAGKHRIIHWLGNDVPLTKDAALRFARARYVHFAQDEHVAERLSGVGLRAQVVPLPVGSPAVEIHALPQTFTLMLYLPRDRGVQHGRFQFERLLTALRDEPIAYILVGGGSMSVPPGVRVEQLGWRTDLGAIYDRSTALARFTQADTVSVMVLEALLHGRYVLWSNEFPFVTRVEDYCRLENEVRKLLRLHRTGLLAPNMSAAHHIGHAYGPQRCVEVFEESCLRRTNTERTAEDRSHRAPQEL